MRVPILLFCASIMSVTVSGEVLTDADREALLDNLDKIQETADSKVDSKYRVALVAYRNAMNSDDAAIELYLNCMERVNFEEEQKKSADFREWKRKESEKLSVPGLRQALRHQLRWLILTLQASTEKAEREKLAGTASEILEAMFREPERLIGQSGTLEQSVTDSVFAKAYDINHIKVDNWPMSPVQLDQVYNNIILPTVRKSSNVEELQAMWIKRIQQESAKIEFFNLALDASKNAPKISSPDHQRFLSETRPKLQWEMEVDLFRNGDESAASIRMLAHLEKYVAHSSAQEWGKQFRELLKPAPGS